MCAGPDRLYTTLQEIKGLRAQYAQSEDAADKVALQKQFEQLQCRALSLFFLRGPEEFRWLGR